MLYLRGNEALKATNVNIFIRNFANAVELSFNKCDECGGTGLYGVHRHEQGASWDGVSYCEKCDGTGYIDWNKSEAFTVCDACSGVGCSKCENKGVVDWIQAARYGILK